VINFSPRVLIDFESELFFKVQYELDKIETLLNHIARLHTFDIVPRDIREIFREELRYRFQDCFPLDHRISSNSNAASARHMESGTHGKPSDRLARFAASYDVL
jgi:hypothetical protein